MHAERRHVATCNVSYLKQGCFGYYHGYYHKEMSIAVQLRPCKCHRMPIFFLSTPYKAPGKDHGKSLHNWEWNVWYLANITQSRKSTMARVCIL